MGRHQSSKYDAGARVLDRFTVLSRDRTHIHLRCDNGHERQARLSNVSGGKVHCQECPRPVFKLGRPKGLAPDKASHFMYAIYKSSAKSRGHDFNLTFEQFHALIDRNCHYCGAGHSNRYVTQAGDVLTYNGLDRVDNDKGYETGNVVSCCQTCNFAKRKMSRSEFLAWINRVFNHQYG